MSTDYYTTTPTMPMGRNMARDIIADMPDLPEEIPEITAAELISLGTEDEEAAHAYLKACAEMYGFHTHTCYYCGWRVTSVDLCATPNTTGYCSYCMNL